MKTKITEVITSKEEAMRFLAELAANDEDYDPEDDARFIYWFTCSPPTPRECELLNMRMEEVFYFIPDPLGFIINSAKLN